MGLGPGLFSHGTFSLKKALMITWRTCVGERCDGFLIMVIAGLGELGWLCRSRGLGDVKAGKWTCFNQTKLYFHPVLHMGGSPHQSGYRLGR